jgi:hypothetical protein
MDATDGQPADQIAHPGLGSQRAANDRLGCSAAEAGPEPVYLAPPSTPPGG